MLSRISLTFAAFALSAALATPAAAETVYEQPGATAACAGACWTSSFGDGVGFQAYDNFVLSADATITGAKWRGFIQPNGAVGPVDPAIQNWTVSFSADNGSGAPGTVLASTTFAAADVTTTFLGVSAFDGPVNVYEFSVNFAGFAATAGTTYWFSPFATQEHFYPFFSWSPAVLPGDDSFQVFRPAGDTFVRFGDRAFSLSANVPEPATWAMMLMGFGALGALVRRRRSPVLA